MERNDIRRRTARPALSRTLVVAIVSSVWLLAEQDQVGPSFRAG
jgi:hypothetical protein